MTCRLAFSYSRDVYALPGRADDVRSQGCNNLIKSKIAEPLTSVEELMESLGLYGRKQSGRETFTSMLRRTYSGRLQEDILAHLLAIASIIEKTRGITVEEIASKTGLAYPSVLNLTSMLEIDGHISIDLLQRCFMNMGKFR